jgi:polysaccharide biosynthesis/export protein
VIRLQALLLLTGFLLLAGLVRAEELPIAPGDRLNVVVAGEADLSRVYTVDLDGNIFIAMIGKVPVKGMFPAQVREDLTKRLSRIIRDPQVSVDFMERAQITVGFTGMVGMSGRVTLKKGSRLLEGLAQAQGLTPELADARSVRLTRRGEATARILDLTRIAEDASLNVELQDGDDVYIPRIPMHLVRVLGAVNKPGEILRKERLTLLDAVLAAGGITADADRRQVQVMRKGALDPAAVNLDDVLTGKANVLLEDGDVVTIPATPKILVKVFGNVTRPGEIQMRAGSTILEAITAMGGFTMEADKTAVMLTDPNGEARRANLEQVNSPDGAVALTDGSAVYVPLATPLRFAVSGGVATPGLFPMPVNKQKLFLTDAIAQAGGLVERAEKKRVLVIRKNPNGGEPLRTQIDYDAYVKGKNPGANVEIASGDVVYVDVKPTPGTKRPAWETILGLVGAFAGI